MSKNNIHDEYWSYHNRYIKKYNSKTVILMQVGSFHEAYSTDTIGPNLFELSELLNIVCTRKDKSVLTIDEKNPYMLGFPSCALSKYLRILVDANYTVVVIDQTTPAPKPVREVTGVYSAATYLDGSSIETKYLVVLYIETNHAINSNKNNISIGMCAVDITTAHVIYYESHGQGIVNENEAFDEAQRFYHTYRPVELIIYSVDNSTDESTKFSNKIINKLDILPNQILYTYNKINPVFTKLSYQNTLLRKVYPVCGLESPIEFLDLSKAPHSIVAIISAYDYIYQHNENLIKDLKIPQYFDEHKYMILGNSAQYQLNIIDYFNWNNISFNSKFQSLNSVVNNCLTPMGKRTLQQRLCAPYTDSSTITKSYNLTDLILESGINDKIRQSLKGTKDLDKLFRKISLNCAQPSELFQIHESFQNMVNVITILYNSPIMKSNMTNLFNKKSVNKFVESINYLENTFCIEKLQNTNLNEVSESFYKNGIYNLIDELSNNIDNNIGTITKLANKLTEFDSSINCTIQHNQRDGYYLNTSKIRGEKLQEIFAKMTVTSPNFMIKINKNLTININELQFAYYKKNVKITYSELNTHSNEIDDLYIELKNELSKCFKNDLSKWYEKYNELFKKLISFIIEIDMISNNAYTSSKYHYTRPQLSITGESYIQATQLRHPIIERIIDYEYTPHDIVLNNETKGHLIYGVNSCGKSSLMKAIGLNLILAQCGMFVAGTGFEYGIFDSLYTRISGNDNLFKAQSSFIVELNEMRTILKNSNSKSLVIGDEICRGTEYLSANAMVAATIVRLINLKTKFIFATHLHDLVTMDVISKLKDLSEIKFSHLAVENKGDELIFNRKLTDGTGEQIYGITIAKHILDDPIFINMSIEFKNELLAKSNVVHKLINDKKSLYNKDIYMDACSVCGSVTKLESHHINHQKDFTNNINGIINNNKKHILKDSQANLVVLCAKCHDNVHNSSLSINNIVKSTNGLKII